MVATSGSSTDESSSLNRIPKLKGKDEFLIWCSDFEYFLRIKELWTIVTGEEEVPVPYTEEELEDESLTDKQKRVRVKKIKEYEKKVAMTWYIFRQALSPDYLSILELTPVRNAVLLWANIKANFGQSNTTVNKLSLFEQFSALKMEETTAGNFRDAFNRACARMEKICSDLATFNSPIQDEMKLGKLFTLAKGVHVQMDTFAANLIRTENINWAKAYDQLNDRFRELDLDGDTSASSSQPASKKKGKTTNPEVSVESVANLVKNLKSFARKFKKSSNGGKRRSFSNGGAHKSGKKKRQSSDQKDDTDSKKESSDGPKKKRDLKDIQCYRCKKFGHFKGDCPDNNEANAALDVAEDFDLMKILNDDHRAFQAEQANVTTTADVNLAASRNEEAMIMDSGSNRTHVQRQDMLTGYTPNLSSVTVANGSKVESKGTGKLGNLEATHTDLSSNLLSIGQLCDVGYHVLFTRTHAIVSNGATKKTVCRGVRYQGLYFIGTKEVAKIPIPSGGAVAYLASTTPLKGIDTWHARTHLSDDSLVKASKIVDGVKLTKADLYSNPSICKTCAICKISRRQFKKKNHRPDPSGLFKLVSSDIGGPVTPVGMGGVNYMIVFVDEYSRYKYLYFLANKDEALEKFRHFRSQQVVAYGFSLSELLTDNGGEYIGSDFEEFCIDSAVVHKTTSPYTPEENSTTEVYWRTLMQMVRSFLKASVLPSNLWPFAAKHANFVLNRMLTVTIGDTTKTPYEWRFNLRPNLKHVRVWGCPVIYKVHGHVRKLADKGRDGYYLGADTNSRSVVILDKETRKIVKSGHVLFNEIIPRRLEVDGQEDSETIRLWSLQSGEGERTVTEEVTNFDLTDQDRGEDGLFNSTSLEHTEELSDDDEEEGELEGDARFADEEPDEEYWPTEKKQRREVTGRTLRSGVSFLAVLSGSTEDGPATPNTYQEALSSHEAPQWRLAIAEELAALEANYTWDVVELPDNFKPLESKWVFKIKWNVDHTPARFKGRLTIKGFIQIHGRDYWETFSPVAKLISLRVFFALAAHMDMHLFQMDVNNAFLNAELKEEIYMRVPDGFDLDSYLRALPQDNKLRQIPSHRIVLKLNKALYGLKQAPREWYLNVSSFIKTKLGYKQLDSDSCLFIRRTDDTISLLALYVDDMVLASTCQDSLQSDVDKFNKEYKMKNIGEPELIVGLNVIRDKKVGTITLSQEKYVHELIDKFGIKDKKVASTAADYGKPLTKAQCPTTDEERLEMAKYPYREVVGSLMYLSVGVRPDISFIVSELSKYLANPGLAHWNAAVRVLRYLKGCPSLGVTYKRGEGRKATLQAYSDFNYKGPSRRQQQKEKKLKLVAFSDADWGGDKDTRRSHTGGVLFLAGGAVAWISKKQSSVAMSSAEAEYMAASLVCREVIWIRSILAEFGFNQDGPTVIREDNEACIQMSKNPVNHSKTKHIDLHYHFVRERVETGEVALDWVSTSEMIADMLTKAVTPAIFKSLRDALFNYHKRR